MLRAWFIASLFLVGLSVSSLYAQEIQFIEDFALAKDRTVPLKQLIPGTEDYYYYHVLHYQNTEKFDKAEETIQAWIKRYRYTGRVKQMINRQKLLTYDENPDATLAHLKSELNLYFNHQRESDKRKNKLPTSLDQNRISFDTLSKEAFSRHNNLQGFEDRALDWVVNQNLNDGDRKDLLRRIRRPDHDNLVKQILAELNHKYPTQFGSYPIHSQLLKSQLDQLDKAKQGLLNQQNFVNVYMTKLVPTNDVDIKVDREEQIKYLDRLWSFVSRLAPVHNSLKANVLYNRLVLDRSMGVYDKDRFMAYLKLPKNTSYVNHKYIQTAENRRYPCNLGANYQQFNRLPPVGSDEPLVRSYFHHFFVKETTYKPYEPYVSDQYLKRRFAETKIVNGLGDQEKWYALLPPAEYQKLKERIDLDFVHTNQEFFATDETVNIDLDIKNVKTLIVKVFEINAKNYYKDNLREIDTDINLDGLVANQENIYEYKEPDLRRVRRHFEFESLNKAGVYVIDFIGNGKSSRALVRKGKLRSIARQSSAGVAIKVFDEANKHRKNASLLLSGREFKADEEGEILVPFSNNPSHASIVLLDGKQASLDTFQHNAETYQLTAGIFVEREALLKRNFADVVIRPSLETNNSSASLSILEDVRLTINSTDLDGVVTTKQVSDFELFDDKDSTYQFQVPARLSSITFTLQAKVKNLSKATTQNLSVSNSFQVNAIDRTERTQDIHFGKYDNNYIIEVLGKSGEAKPAQVVHFNLKHRDFRDRIHFSLESDATGRIYLGPLAGIEYVQANDQFNVSHQWPVQHDERTFYDIVHAIEGQVIKLPVLTTNDKPASDQYSLLDQHSGKFVNDFFKSLSIKNGFLHVSGLKPGDYSLLLKDYDQSITIRVTNGKVDQNFLLGKTRTLELKKPSLLHLQPIEVDKDKLTIQLENTSPASRVHVFATRYEPEFTVFRQFSRVRDMNPGYETVPVQSSVYLAGRDIGDEYRYIIDRQYVTKFPGNMLQRPSMLLNPWALRSTETDVQVAQAGEAYNAKGGMRGKRSGNNANRGQGGGAAIQPFSNLDYLGNASVSFLNLKPNKKGVLTIARDELKGNQQIHIVALDGQSTVYRTLALPEQKTAFKDLRLTNGLDVKKHFSQQKQITVVPAKEKFTLGDVATSRFESYDTLAKVYGLYSTLNSNPHLAEFGFILNWPEMKEEEKREKYSKYSSHELNFFIFKKDPVFFKKVVLPYIVHKRDQTFMDKWLINQDAKGYLQSWSHGQLNIVERILVSQKVRGEAKFTSQHVTDLYDLLPPDIDRFNRLFDTAIKSSALETTDALGYLSRTKEYAKKAEMERPAAEFKAAGKAMDKSKSGFYAGRAATAAPSAPPKPQASAGPGSKNAPADNALADLEVSEELMRKAPEKLSKQLNALMQERNLRDEKRRRSVRQFYRKLESTKEWVENNYYNLPIEQQNSNLVKVNGFWKDYAGHDAKKPFYSNKFPDASRNFTEMMFALSVLDLPFKSEKHETKFEQRSMEIAAASPMIIFHEEILPVDEVVKNTPVLVSQNFFRHGDRYQQVNNERVDKYVTDEFLVHTVYGCQVVVTNPTSTPQKLDVLLQIPTGALPVMNSKYTKSAHIHLGAFSTQTMEYYFYFPNPGKEPHYPVQVAKNEEVIAFTQPFTFNVVKELSNIDKASWAYISQNGTTAQVFDYLKTRNVNRVNLDKIAWRMQDKKFFTQAIAILARKHVYNHTLWSYGVKHNDVPSVREFLQHANSFVNRCGVYLDSTLLTIDPVIRKTYQHRDYRPLVNARAHQLSRRRKILNNRFYTQYHQLMNVLSHRRDMTDEDLMSVTYYYLLQDRVEEAMESFAKVNSKKLNSQLQYDYFTAYLDFYNPNPEIARELATKYENYPVDKWKNLFKAVGAQLDELETGVTTPVDPEQRTQQQTQLASTESNFDFKVEAKKIFINHQNLEKVTVNYYLMDIELLFSRNPFVQKYSSQFTYIRPNVSAAVALKPDNPSAEIPLPEEFHNSNVLVEIIGDGVTKQQAYYSNALAVQVVENYGQVKIADSKKHSPLPKTYIKVYAKMKNGSVKFYKDGYTDLRGRFDYSSLNTNELDQVDKFSLLVLNDENGAMVKEVTPPKQ